MTDFVRLGALAEIPYGEMRAYDVAWGRVAIAHVEHRLFAFADECSHQGCPLSEGGFDDRTAQVTCMCHQSVFDVETGEPVDGPAADPIAIYPARELDGWLEVAAEASADG